MLGEGWRTYSDGVSRLDPTLGLDRGAPPLADAAAAFGPAPGNGRAQPTAMTVCALIVTFNRKELLACCIDAVLAQTSPVSELYVVDNASTDGTPELLRERGYLDRPEIRYVRLDENSGSSGGFAAGIAAGRRSEADWLWVMDDDAEPEPETLERLLTSDAAGDPETAALCSTVIKPDGSVDLRHRGAFRRRPRPLPLSAYEPGSVPELDFFTFVSVLFPMRVVRAEEPPFADFFIWCDDYEYSFRIRDHGRIRLVADSRMLHRDAGQSYTNRRSRFWNRMFGWSYDPTPIEGFWRNICGVRNYVWIKKRYEGQGPLGSWLTIGWFVLKTLLYDERPLRRIPWLVRYGRAGRRDGEFANVSPAEWAAMVRRSGAERRRAIPRARRS